MTYLPLQAGVNAAALAGSCQRAALTRANEARGLARLLHGEQLGHPYVIGRRCCPGHFLWCQSLALWHLGHCRLCRIFGLCPSSVEPRVGHS